MEVYLRQIKCWRVGPVCPPPFVRHFKFEPSSSARAVVPCKVATDWIEVARDVVDSNPRAIETISRIIRDLNVQFTHSVVVEEIVEEIDPGNVAVHVKLVS